QGFMSHESLPSAAASGGRGGYRLRAGPLTGDGAVTGASRHTQRRTATSPASTAAAPDLVPPSASPHTPPHQPHQHHYEASSHPHPHPHSHPHPHPHPHPHAHLHSGFHTQSLAVEGRPVGLRSFADWVLKWLVREPGSRALLRSKGVLWVSECRSRRFTFHLSGRRRVECSLEGPWEGPPRSCLVLIGSEEAAVRRLMRTFEREVLQQQQRG
ncbi:hypothetical protein Agub_g1717, partial [Astrephomene gubernaculifera]